MDLIGYAPAAEYKTGVCPRTRTREKGSIGWQWLSATKRGKRGTAAGAWLSRKETRRVRWADRGSRDPYSYGLGVPEQ